MAKTMATHILLYVQLIAFVFCGPLPPYHLKCERSLAGLEQDQLKEVHKQATVTTDNFNPLLSWTIQHTGKYRHCLNLVATLLKLVIPLYRLISVSESISSDTVRAS